MTDNTQELDEIDRILFRFSVGDIDEKLSGIFSEEALIRGRVEAMNKDPEFAKAKQAILDWHNKQVEEAMAKFNLKKGVKYDVKASNSVIVITHTNKLKGRDDDQL